MVIWWSYCNMKVFKTVGGTDHYLLNADGEIDLKSSDQSFRQVEIFNSEKTTTKNRPCYIIAEGFFFILSFFVGYILSFGLVRLRTIRFSARAGAHIECRCSCSRAEDVTITNVIIKTPDRKWNWGVKDVMPGSDGLRILVIFEKSS